MTLTPESLHSLYATPDGLNLTEQLTAAYQRNVEEGLVTPSESVTAAAAAAIAAARLAPALHEQQPALANLEPGIAGLVEAAHASTRQLFERISVDTPDLTEFQEAGIDFARLGVAYEAMTKLGLEPQLVLAPVLEHTQWTGLFQELQDDASVNHDGRIKSGGLWVNNDVQANWDTLQGDQHNIEVGGQQWQVVVMPGTGKPSILNIDHRGIVDSEGHGSPDLHRQANDYVPPEQHDPRYMHPTISTYLTLQASKLQANEAPLDGSTYSWLDGEFGDPSSLQAPSGFWYSDHGRVVLSQNVVGYRFDDLGVRLPVWGE